MTEPRENSSEFENYRRESDVNIALMRQAIEHMDKKIGILVTRDEFAPVKLIAYGLATAVLGSVMFALLSKVLIK